MRSSRSSSSPRPKSPTGSSSLARHCPAPGFGRAPAIPGSIPGPSGPAVRIPLGRRSPRCRRGGAGGFPAPPLAAAAAPPLGTRTRSRRSPPLQGAPLARAPALRAGRRPDATALARAGTSARQLVRAQPPRRHRGVTAARRRRFGHVRPGSGRSQRLHSSPEHMAERQVAHRRPCGTRHRAHSCRRGAIADKPRPGEPPRHSWRVAHARATNEGDERGHGPGRSARCTFAAWLRGTGHARLAALSATLVPTSVIQPRPRPTGSLRAGAPSGGPGRTSPCRRRP